MNDKKSTLFFIVNPRAGSGKTMCEWLPAEKELEMAGVRYVTAMTDHKRHATSLAMEACQQGYRKIIAVGGDGSLHEVFNGICRWCENSNCDISDFYIGVIPIGSGNDWIKSLGVEKDAKAALECVCRSEYRMMDVIRVESSGSRVCYMANVGGTGFDSHVCLRVNSQKESGKRGKLIYLNSLIYTIATLRSIRVACYADGKMVFSGDCYSIALGNGRYSGSGMRQVPAAEIDDSLVDYLIIPRLPLGRIMLEAPRLFTGTINESRYVISGQCKSFKVMPLDSESEDVLELDGELEGRLPMSVEVLPSRIRVMTMRAKKNR